MHRDMPGDEPGKGVKAGIGQGFTEHLYIGHGGG